MNEQEATYKAEEGVEEPKVEPKVLTFKVDTDKLANLTLGQMAILQSPKELWDMIDVINELTIGLDAADLTVDEVKQVGEALGDEMTKLSGKN